jgi:hypothetical protein
MQLDPAERIATIAAGLGLLAENVATLAADLELLRKAERGRGLWILSRQADEEAAKALILIDLARMDQRDHKGMVRQIGCFYDHLSRSIYAEVCQMSPADFAEVRRMVDSMRQSHFLDGPNEVDWIFRNRLLASREDGLYVDYLHEQDGGRWISPAANDEIIFGGPSTAVIELIAAMHRLGCMSPGGLKVIADIWAEQTIEDDTHWQEVVRLNRAVATELVERGLALPESSGEDSNRVINRWTFPLSGLDLSEVKVSLSDLEEQQKGWAPV